MLETCSPGRLLGDVHVVELLAVLAEYIRVAFSRWNASNDVEIEKAGCAHESLQGLDEGELVEVSSGNNGRIGVTLQNLANEIASCFGLFSVSPVSNL
jgi:hypothetical protein